MAYDAVEAAQNRGRDLVIIDTAGRLHTKVNLMEELKKIHRVLNKRLEGAPHEVLLVLDATTGQNALSQAKLFNEAVPLTGLVLTKLDGTAKGGVVVAIAEAMKLPICFVGVGESLEDLRPFDPGSSRRPYFKNRGNPFWTERVPPRPLPKFLARPRIRAALGAAPNSRAPTKVMGWPAGDPSAPPGSGTSEVRPSSSSAACNPRPRNSQASRAYVPPAAFVPARSCAKTTT